VPTYVYLYEDLGNIRDTRTTQELNTKLYGLQEHGAKIRDVKISTVDKPVGVLRSILIIYEADRIIEP
jgi:hypothetical protein